MIEKFSQKKNQFELCIYLYKKLIQQIRTQQFVYSKNLGEHENLISYDNPFFKTQKKREMIKKRLSQKEYIQEINQVSESNIKNMKINTIKRKSNAQTPKSILYYLLRQNLIILHHMKRCSSLLVNIYYY